jgi:predicted dehydrogenase/uncharacterized membrane protein YbhN (UPF0104 family)
LAVKLRGALLGAGNIAIRSHVPQWVRDERLHREIEIVAVADLAGANLAAAREFLPDARLYTEAEALLDREQLDFCDICTPPFSHRRLIEQAAARGVHIVCEKPLAPTLDDADHIAQTVREASVVFRPCHQYHYSPQWLAVRRLLPRLGRVYFAEYQVLRAEANEGNPNWEPAWRTNPAMAGGGILVDHGAHIIYQLRAALGDPLTVHATVGRLVHHQYEVEDTALVTLDYGDRLAHISLTWAARRRAIQFRFVGERGELAGDDQRIELLTDRREEIRFEEGMSKDSSHSEWYTPLLREFSLRVREGGPSYEALDEAVHVTRVIERAYESARLGHALPLTPASAPQEGTSAAQAGIAREMTGTRAEAITAPAVPAAASALAPSGGGRRQFGWMLRSAVILAVLVMAFVTLRGIKWNDLAQAIRASDPLWLALAAALNLGVVALAATRWLALLRPLSPNSRWRDAFAAVAVGFAVSTVVPARGGEVVRMEFLHRRSGLPKAQITGSIGLDQLMNSAGFMVGLALLPWLGGIPGWMRPGSILALVLFTAAMVAVVLFRPTGRRVVSAVKEGPTMSPGGILGRLRLGLTAARSPRALTGSLMASLAAWTLELIVMRIAMRAVGIALPISATVVVLMAVNVMIAIPAAPANIGTLEVGAVLGLVGFGIGKEKALAFALLYHALQTVPVAILGFSVAAGDNLAGWLWEGGA